MCPFRFTLACPGSRLPSPPKHFENDRAERPVSLLFAPPPFRRRTRVDTGFAHAWHRLIFRDARVSARGCLRDVPVWKTVGMPANSTCIYKDQTQYTIQDGACKAVKVGPSGDPPALPFSFLVMDNDSRGAAAFVKNTTLDGLNVEQWSHARGPSGTMFWYIQRFAAQENVQMVRTDYHPTAGGSGSRDFSDQWKTPAAAGSFDLPSSCNNVVVERSAADATAAIPAFDLFGDF